VRAMKSSMLVALSVAVVLAAGLPARAQRPTVESLIQMIEDPDTSAAERQRALKQLRPFGDRAAAGVPAPAKVRESKAAGGAVWLVRDVYWALWPIGKAAVPVLLEGLKKPEPHPEWVAELLFKMSVQGNMDLKEAVPGLVEFLDKNREKPPRGSLD